MGEDTTISTHKTKVRKKTKANMSTKPSRVKGTAQDSSTKESKTKAKGKKSKTDAPKSKVRVATKSKPKEVLEGGESTDTKEPSVLKEGEKVTKKKKQSGEVEAKTKAKKPKSDSATVASPSKPTKPAQNTTDQVEKKKPKVKTSVKSPKEKRAHKEERRSHKGGDKRRKKKKRKKEKKKAKVRGEKDKKAEKPAQKTASSGDQPSPEESQEDEYAGSEIRCICGRNTDKGIMMQCESCEVWQHAACFGFKSEDEIPEKYYCEICSADMKKPPEEVARSLFSCIRSVKLRTMAETAFVELPDELQKRSKNGRPRSAVKGETVLYCIADRKLIGEFANLYWEGTRQHKDDICRLLSIFTQRSMDHIQTCLRKLADYVVQFRDPKSSNEEYLPSIQLPTLQEPQFVGDCASIKLEKTPSTDCPTSWRILADQDIGEGEVVGDYTGDESPAESIQLEFLEVPFYEPPYHILFHGDECVDARKKGNKLKYIRRSCTPNCTVKKQGNKYRIFTTSKVAKDSELSLPFESPNFWKYFHWSCGCPSKECEIQKAFSDRITAAIHFLERKFNRSGVAKRSRSEVEELLDTTLTPPRPLGRKGREERKIEQIVRRIQQIENREERKRKLASPELGGAKKRPKTPSDERKIARARKKVRDTPKSNKRPASTPRSLKGIKRRRSYGASDRHSPNITHVDDSMLASPSIIKVASPPPPIQSPFRRAFHKKVWLMAHKTKEEPSKVAEKVSQLKREALLDLGSLNDSVSSIGRIESPVSPDLGSEVASIATENAKPKAEVSTPAEPASSLMKKEDASGQDVKLEPPSDDVAKATCPSAPASLPTLHSSLTSAPVQSPLPPNSPSKLTSSKLSLDSTAEHSSDKPIEKLEPSIPPLVPTIPPSVPSSRTVKTTPVQPRPLTNRRQVPSLPMHSERQPRWSSSRDRLRSSGWDKGPDPHGKWDQPSIGASSPMSKWDKSPTVGTPSRWDQDPKSKWGGPSSRSAKWDQPPMRQNKWDQQRPERPERPREGRSDWDRPREELERRDWYGRRRGNGHRSSSPYRPTSPTSDDMDLDPPKPVPRSLLPTPSAQYPVRHQYQQPSPTPWRGNQNAGRADLQSPSRFGPRDEEDRRREYGGRGRGGWR